MEKTIKTTNYGILIKNHLFLGIIRVNNKRNGSWGFKSVGD